jgi:hypothetical protein
MTPEEEEERFRRGLVREQEAKEVFGAYLRTLGYEVFVKPLRIRPKFQDRAAYSDGGADILMGRPGKPLEHKVEVKRRSRNFACAGDYPYPTINLERVDKIEKYGLALLYANVSDDLNYACCTMAKKTRSAWVAGDAHDTTRDYSEYQIYRVPTELCRFVAIR